MKVRWREDSLRLRITPEELAALQSGASVKETAAFPGGWSVSLQPGATSSLRSPAPGVLVLSLTHRDLAELARPDSEGVYFTEEGYRYFIEKDFPCVHPRPAEAPESTATFPPPRGFAERHGAG